MYKRLLGQEVDRLSHITVSTHSYSSHNLNNSAVILRFLFLQAHLVRGGKAPVIQTHAEMAAHARRAPTDLFVIVQKDLRASAATPGSTPIACHTHVRRNKFAGSV